MDCDTVPSYVNGRNRLYNKFKDDYKLDLWFELKKRWLILGVLVSILLAVVSPRIGAPGGPLHPEYLSYAPLSYIYYSSGRRTQRPKSLYACMGACALTTAHAHIVAPALCAIAASSAADIGLHQSLVKGALLSCLGGPCAWLSLCAARDATTAAMCLAASYIVAAPAAPATLYIICGRAPIPALGPSIWSALCTLPPFIGGILYTHVLNKNSCCTEALCSEMQHCAKTLCSQTQDCTKTLCSQTQHCTKTLCLQTQWCSEGDCTSSCVCVEPCMMMARVCALVLVYFDCCERLREAEGSMHVGDVLGTLVFAVVYLSLSALCWCVYARALGGRAHAPTLAACALPKGMLAGWEVSTACVAGGAARLPAACLAPAHALLLAAIAHQPRTERRDRHLYHPLPQQW